MTRSRLAMLPAPSDKEADQQQRQDQDQQFEATGQSRAARLMMFPVVLARQPFTVSRRPQDPVDPLRRLTGQLGHDVGVRPEGQADLRVPDDLHAHASRHALLQQQGGSLGPWAGRLP